MSRNESVFEPLLSVTSAARVLGLSRATAWRLVWAGELPTVRIGGRVLVEPETLRQFIADRRSNGSEKTTARLGTGPVANPAGSGGEDDSG
ncbi:MAG: helix-turn-helix domain-containing protein [Actinobacteria bacterium]|nr:helix-turn-helix domain-containing protein [Actinomycetota bacterium]